MHASTGKYTLEDNVADVSDVDRTILLMGKTGVGKSTLGNVIAGTHNQFPPAEIFSEGEYLTSATTTTTKEHITTIRGKMYRIVDTFGIGDTGLQENNVLLKFARACHYLRNGINQILFVSSGKFTREEVETYDILRSILFCDNVGKFMTLVRTRSPFFLNVDKCAADIKFAKESGTPGRTIIEDVVSIIHVNNPNEECHDNWVHIREMSRMKLVDQIEKCSELYRPPNLDRILKNIGDNAEKQDELQGKLMRLQAQQEEKEEAHQMRMFKINKRMEELQEQGEVAKDVYTALDTQMKGEQERHERDLEELHREIRRNKTEVEMTMKQETKKLYSALESNMDQSRERLATLQEDTTLYEGVHKWLQMINRTMSDSQDVNLGMTNTKRQTVVDEDKVGSYVGRKLENTSHYLESKRTATVSIAREAPSITKDVVEQHAKLAQPPDCSENTAVLADDPDAFDRTIILLGRTGTGKSTLGNVIAGGHKHEPPVEVFEEGCYWTSTTEHASEHRTVVRGLHYRIIDTVGIGDTRMALETVLTKLAQTVHYLHNGISQILFVVGDRLTKEEVQTLDIIEQVLFDQTIWEFVTIVRAKVAFFQIQEKCEEDIRRGVEHTCFGWEMFKRAKKIIHVNNPPEDENDQWIAIREQSRNKVITWIANCKQRYKPPTLAKITANIKEQVIKQEKLEKQIELLQKQQKEKEEEHSRKVCNMNIAIDKLKKQVSAAHGKITTLTNDLRKERAKHKTESEALRKEVEKANSNLKAAKTEEQKRVCKILSENIGDLMEKVIAQHEGTSEKEDQCTTMTSRHQEQGQGHVVYGLRVAAPGSDYVTPQLLDKIAPYLSKHEIIRLATALEFNYKYINRLRLDDFTRQTAYDLLYDWKGNYASATSERLCDALKKIGRHDLAAEITRV